MTCKFFSKKTLAFLLCLMISIALTGCTGKSDSASPEAGGLPEDMPEKSKKTTAIYYDFEDVLVPLELKINKSRTVVVSTPGFKSGILSLKGRVDSNSLFNFFSNNMVKDNWNVISKIKSPGTIIMVFQKTSRCAVITIRESSMNTYVDIGVAPTLEGNGENALYQTDITN